ncbi:LruC domain-containing protein [Bacteroides sp.]|uniref:LruC domain-containing protein n=1 Tax=Bacteroides sp. TaxID=29523 RepID=UPI003AB4625F
MKKGVIGLLVMTCTLAGCQQDAYDSNYNPNLGAHVPENFDWSTTKALTVNVEVNDEYDGKYYYAVRVYDKAPGEGILPVAASGEVTGDMPFSQKIVIPATVSKLYIAQVFKNANASEIVTMKEVAVEGTAINHSFGNSSKTRSVANTRSDSKKITDASEIKGSGEYKIEKDVTITMGSSITGSLKDVEIEIEGTLIINGDAKLHGWEIDVEDTGKLTVNGDLVLVGNKNDEEKSSSLENNGYVHVTGNLHVEAGAKLDNDDNNDGRLPGGCIIVDGEAHLQSNKIELDERSYMSCGSLKLNASDMKITMETGAWLRVIGALTSAQNCKIGFGDDGKFEKPKKDDYIKDTEYVGLLQVGSWGNNGKDNLTVEKEILVESPERGSHNIGSWTENAIGKIVIAGTECSGGFGTDEKYELGTYTYIIEDMYPTQGDYDMNDIVVSMTATQQGTKLTIDGKLKAVGASYKIVPYVKVGNEIQPLFSDQGNALEAHFALAGDETGSTLINTVKNQTSYPEKDFTLVFDGIKEKLNIDNIDFYIKVNDAEVHWNNYSQEEKATWGMRIPGNDFRWPQEKVNITKAYPTFTEWFKDKSYAWYNEPKEDLIY